MFRASLKTFCDITEYTNVDSSFMERRKSTLIQTVYVRCILKHLLVANMVFGIGNCIVKSQYRQQAVSRMLWWQPSYCLFFKCFHFMLRFTDNNPIYHVFACRYRYILAFIYPFFYLIYPKLLFKWLRNPGFWRFLLQNERTAPNWVKMDHLTNKTRSLKWQPCHH